MDPVCWLMINYRLPSEPSRPRVAVWRALKRLGAVSIQQSAWVLSMSDENRSVLLGLCQEIEAAKGECLLMQGACFRPEDERRIIALFNSVRNAEYGELVQECAKYLKEIDKEIGNQKLIYPELEEEEAEYEKLAAWYARIEARDFYNAEGGVAARAMLQQIGKAYDGFSELVYAHEAGE